jgi:hypothetical protein
MVTWLTHRPGDGSSKHLRNVVYFYQTTLRCSSEDSHFHTRSRVNLKSHTMYTRVVSHLYKNCSNKFCCLRESMNILGQIRTVVVIAFTWAGSHTFLFYLKTDVTSVFVTSKIDLHCTETVDSVKRKLLHDDAASLLRTLTL